MLRKTHPAAKIGTAGAGCFGDKTTAAQGALCALTNMLRKTHLTSKIGNTEAGSFRHKIPAHE